MKYWYMLYNMEEPENGMLMEAKSQKATYYMIDFIYMKYSK